MKTRNQKLKNGANTPMAGNEEEHEKRTGDYVQKNGVADNYRKTECVKDVKGGATGRGLDGNVRGADGGRDRRERNWSKGNGLEKGSGRNYGKSMANGDRRKAENGRRTNAHTKNGTNNEGERIGPNKKRHDHERRGGKGGRNSRSKNISGCEAEDLCDKNGEIMDKIMKRVASDLNLEISEAKKMLFTLTHSEHPEMLLYDTLGPLYVDQMRFIIENRGLILRTTKKSTHYYTELVIPPKPIQKNLKTAVNPYKIFPYRNFNSIQTEVHTIARSTNNFLLAAPTGTGKTDVAMMCIMGAKRVVYVVPLRALATEIVGKLRKKFSCEECARLRRQIDRAMGLDYSNGGAPIHDESFQNEPVLDRKTNRSSNDYRNTPFGKPAHNNRYGQRCMDVMEYTGDTPNQSLNTHIVVTTPEKLDASTRKLSFNFRFDLLIIDEIHLLEEERGSVIEALVARFIGKTRIVGLSATVPNVFDVGEFLKGVVFCYGDERRAVAVECCVIGAKGEMRMSEEELKSRRAGYALVHDELVSEGVGQGIHAERHGTEPVSGRIMGKTKPNVAQRLGDVRNEMGNGAGTSGMRANSKNKRSNIVTVSNFDEILVEKLMLCKNQSLIFVNSRHECFKTATFLVKRLIRNEEYTRPASFAYLLNNGVGVHNAGLPRHQRLRVEDLFRRRELKYVVCTKTLAWGVNLPAESVFIKGTEYYSDGITRNVSISDILQIMGRAGRIDYTKEDTVARAFIITNNLQLYVTRLKNKMPLESTLLHNLVNILNAEIARLTIKDLHESKEWFNRTYMAVRVRRNARYYGMEDEREVDDFVELAVRKLEECRMVERSDDGLVCTWEGRVAAYYYLDFSTLVVFVQFCRDEVHDTSEDGDESVAGDRSEDGDDEGNNHANNEERNNHAAIKGMHTVHAQEMTSYPKKSQKSAETARALPSRQQQRDTHVKNSLSIVSERFAAMSTESSKPNNDLLLFKSKLNAFVSPMLSSQQTKILCTIFSSKEFGDILVRQNEQQFILSTIGMSAVVEIKPCEKLLFLTAAHLMRMSITIFSLVSDLSFILKNVGRLMGAFEQLAMLTEKYALCEQVVRLRMRIEEKGGDAHAARAHIEEIIVNERECSILKIEGNADESIFLFLYEQCTESGAQCTYASVLHNKAVLYFARVLRNARIILLSERTGRSQTIILKKRKGPVYNTVFNYRLVIFRLFYKRERVMLMNEEMKRFLEKAHGRILIVGNDCNDEDASSSGVVGKTVQSLAPRKLNTLTDPNMFDLIVIKGCFCLEMVPILNECRKDVYIFENDNVCRFLDEVYR